MPRDYRVYLDDILEAVGQYCFLHSITLKATDSRGNTTAAKQVLTIAER